MHACVWVNSCYCWNSGNSNDSYHNMYQTSAVDSYKLHTVYDVKVEAIVTVAKCKWILLATWESFKHLAMWLIGSASPASISTYAVQVTNSPVFPVVA